MSGRREAIIHRYVLGGEPLDDPLNASWDAVVRDEPTASPYVDADDVAFLRRVHALESGVLPSPAFFGDLEQRLVGLYPPPVASPERIPTAKRSGLGIVPGLPARPSAATRTSRLSSLQGAMAVLAVMMVVSLLVLYQSAPKSSEPPAIPAAVIAKPEIEPITQFEFVPPMWNMPEATAWNHMEIGMFRVAPATSFTTDLPFYTSGEGPLSLTVLNGGLTVTPAGLALFYPANQSSQPPVEISAGKSVSIGQHDTLVFSAMETATGSNSGSEPALVMYGLIGYLEHQPGSSVRPADVSFITYEYVNPISSLPTKGATLTLQRLELAPFDTFVFEPDAEPRYLLIIDPLPTGELRMAEGELEGLVPKSGTRGIYGGSQLRYFKPGTYTIFNVGDNALNFYFLVVEPLPEENTPEAN